MAQYAVDTAVPVDRSKAEIERTLVRYGAESFAYGWEGDSYMIGFRLRGRMLKITLHLPAPNDVRFTRTSQGRSRTEPARREAYEQAVRQQWRALALVIKAKLEAVESGITSMDNEFLGYVMLPNGRTLGDVIGPQIEQSYQTGGMPRLLAAPEGK